MGQYGFAVSTLEAVLQYILESRTYLAELSRQNEELWLAIRQGNINRVSKLCRERCEPKAFDDGHPSEPNSRKRYSAAMRLSLTNVTSLDVRTVLSDLRDADGNNALLLAAGAGQQAMMAFILQLVGGSRKTDVNDRLETPLMRAIRTQSLLTVQLLLAKDRGTRASVGKARDIDGNTAMLLACQTGNWALVQSLYDSHDIFCAQDNTGQGPLHVAPGNLQVRLLNVVPRSLFTWQNNQGETFLHQCVDRAVLENYLEHGNRNVLDVADRHGRTPLHAWAARGRFDMVEVLLDHSEDRDRFEKLDNHGQSVLYLMAASMEGTVVLGSKGLGYTLDRFRKLMNVREWRLGQTPLHRIAKTQISDRNRSIIAEFLEYLILDMNARVDALDFRGARPAHVTNNREILDLLDGNDVCRCAHYQTIDNSLQNCRSRQSSRRTIPRARCGLSQGPQWRIKEKTFKSCIPFAVWL